jgi:predicted DsbA family dithiol-disulfide isomerase
MPESYRARIEAMRPQLIQTAREHYGLEIQAGPFGINSRPALIGAKFAELQGKGKSYHDEVFRAYWQQGQRIDDLGVLTSIAESVGMEADAFQNALQNPDYDAQVSADIMEAMNSGIQGVPAMVFGSKFLVSGAQPYAALVNITEQVQARLGSAG